MQQSRRQESRRSPYRKRPGCQVALSIQNSVLIRRSRLRKSSGLQRSSVAIRFCCYPISLKIRSWRRDMDWTELLQDAAIVFLAISTVCNSVSISRLRRAENFDSWMLDDCRRTLSDLTACVCQLFDCSTGSAAGLSGHDGASSDAKPTACQFRRSCWQCPICESARRPKRADNGNGSAGSEA